MENSHLHPISMLQARILKLENKIWGNENQVKEPQQSCIDTLLEVSRYIGNLQAQKPKIGQLLRQIYDINYFLNPTLGDTAAYSYSSLSENMLSEFDNIQKTLDGLRKVSNLSSVLDSKNLSDTPYFEPEFKRLACVQTEQYQQFSEFCKKVYILLAQYHQFVTDLHAKLISLNISKKS